MRTKQNSLKSLKVFFFTNTPANRNVIQAMRKALNKDRYNLVVRGRGDNRKELSPNTYMSDIPIKNATHLAVYLRLKLEAEEYDRHRARMYKISRGEPDDRTHN